MVRERWMMSGTKEGACPMVYLLVFSVDFFSVWHGMESNSTHYFSHTAYIT